MKILVVGDVHWSSSSSIITRGSEKFTLRLTNLINSVNWAERLAEKKECSEIIYLGDFFDKPLLSDIEVTALNEITWASSIKHTVIVGNHESSVSSLDYKSTSVLSRNNIEVISTPTRRDISSEYLGKEASLYFLPYSIEDDRIPFSELLQHLDQNRPFNHRIVFSHNDLKNFRMGKFLSTIGYDIEDIQKNCDLFINGHLHNGGFVNEEETILNLGNLTGQNFSEDAYQYSHLVCVLDTDTMQLEFYENPNAFNFYNVEINDKTDFQRIQSLKNNAVLSIKCEESLVTEVRDICNGNPSVLASRVISCRRDTGVEEEVKQVELTNSNYLQEFAEFVFTKLGTSKITKEEVEEVIR